MARASRWQKSSRVSSLHWIQLTAVRLEPKKIHLSRYAIYQSPLSWGGIRRFPASNFRVLYMILLKNDHWWQEIPKGPCSWLVLPKKQTIHLLSPMVAFRSCNVGCMWRFQFTCLTGTSKVVYPNSKSCSYLQSCSLQMHFTGWFKIKLF